MFICEHCVPLYKQKLNNMEFKGTKGKWYRNTKSSIVSSVYSENEEKLIHISGKNNEEAKANALLISKAPEMLEMLQLWCMDMEERGHAYGDCYTMTKQLIKEATEL